MKCCICGREFPEMFGNNPAPVMTMETEDGKENRCCDVCNMTVVIPVRVDIARRIEEAKRHNV